MHWGLRMTELITEAQSTFDHLGWLANLIAIGTPAFGFAFFLHKYWAVIFGTSTFVKQTNNLITPKWHDSDSIRKIAEIAIVDDNPNDFPTAELRKAGYRVKTYKQVSLNDISSLAEYDVVFLDIHGIVKDDIEEGGLKLLPKLREANSRQKICAVSSKSFDPTATAFFRQADDVQKKPVNAQKCQDVIEALALEKLNPTTLATHLDIETNYLSAYKQRVLLEQLKKFAATTKPLSEMAAQVSATGKLSPALNYLLIDYVRVLRYAIS